MTVKELKEQLEKYDDSTEVFIEGDFMENLESIRRIRVNHRESYLGSDFLFTTRSLLNLYFQINDSPAGNELSPGQLQIASTIIFEESPRVACLAPTGYGKSEAVALAAAFCCAKYDEGIVIAAQTYKTAGIIMKTVIEHLFDSKLMSQELEIDNKEKLSRLKRERNKSTINFRGGGSITIVSLHGKDDDVSKAIGEHKRKVILDESPLLTAAEYLMVLKIMEGTGEYEDTFLFELGNAVNRNHFMFNVKSNPKYLRLDIPLDQAIAEGRLSLESVEEKRGLPFFEQFYLCQFPAADEIDSKGFRQLLVDETITAKMVDEIGPSDEPMRLGVDIAAGGDYNVYVIRQGKYAWIEASNRSNDTMTNVIEIERIIDKYTIEDEHGKRIRLLPPEHIFIDDIGIGRGVVDRLQELKHDVNGVAVGGKPIDTTLYSNIKAENYWSAKLWCDDPDTRLLSSDKWMQLAWIKYKVNSDKVIQIEPKPDLKQRTGKSPDFAEAFMLTFTPDPPTPNIRFL